MSTISPPTATAVGCGMLGPAQLGLCHMGCKRAPASLRLSLLRGSVRSERSAPRLRAVAARLPHERRSANKNNQ
eukprot:scaffold78179_cov29-Tisochrysis_lutea.AAC.5